MNYISIILGSIFVNNYVLAQFLGICPALGVSKKLDTSIGMGLAVTFVITLASVITLLVDKYILVALNIEYLRTLAFILVIASLVQFVEMFLKKSSPGLYNALGVFLPLITTNCVVLGVAIVNVDKGYNILETIANSISASLGFTLALVLLSAIRERYETVDLPKSFRGIPIALMSLGLLSIAFFGFKGLV